LWQALAAALLIAAVPVFAAGGGESSVALELTEKARWTLDVFHKSGREHANPEGELRRAAGASVTYDFDPHFVRIDHNPYVNFTGDYMTRVALSMRY